MAAFLNPPQEVRGFPSAEEVWDVLPEHKREVLFSKFLARLTNSWNLSKAWRIG